MHSWLVKARRVVWIPIVTTLAAGALAWLLVSSQNANYRASLLLVVPATSSPATGAEAPPTTGDLFPTSSTTTPADILGRPSEAQRLASTYAELIPNDVKTLEVVSAAVDRPLSDVRERVRATAVPDSSLVRVTYTSPSRTEASEALEALQEAVATDEPVTPAIAGGSLVFVSFEDPEKVSGAARAAVPSALLVGLVFGVFVAVAWARTDPRADSADEVGTVLDVPVFDLDPADDDRLVQVFRAIAQAASHPGGGPTTLVVMAVSSRSREAARGVATLLGAGSARPSADRPAVRAVYGGIATGGPTPATFVEGDGVLLVTVRGERVRLLTHALDGIRRLGGEVAGTVLVMGSMPRDALGATPTIERAPAPPIDGGGPEPAAAGEPTEITLARRRRPDGTFGM